MQQTNDAFEYINLAQDDAFVCHSLRNIPQVAPRIICFHAQQAIEKACKSLLISKNIPPRRTHDLTELALMVEEAGIQFPIPIHQLAYLTPYAVTIRYGGDEEGAMDIDEACNIMDIILAFARNKIDK